MKGNACTSLHRNCFLKKASLFFSGLMLTPTVQIFFFSSSYLNWDWCTHEKKKLLIISEVASRKEKDPAYPPFLKGGD